MKNSSNTRLIFTIVGIIFISLALLVNQFTWLTFFDSDGSLHRANKLFLWILDIFFLVTGILFITYRSKIILPSKKEITLLLIICVLCAILMEIGFRYYLLNYSSNEHYLTYATKGMVTKYMRDQKFRYSAHPYLGYYPTPNFKNDKGDKHNSLGYRGEEIIIEKPEKQYRIVCIGGSTTYTTGVDTYKKSYPYLLEKKLKNMGYTNISVINAGVGNADTWYSLINLEFRVLDLDPDMIILYHGDNDLESRLVYPFESYRGDNTGRVTTLFENSPNENILQKSVVIRFVAYNIPILDVLIGGVYSHGSLHRLYSAKTYVYGDYFYQKNHNIYPQGIFKSIDGIDIFNGNPPIYTKRNIRNMIAICRANNIDCVLTSFAYAPLSEETTSEIYKKGIKEINQIFKDLASYYKINFFDFAAVMPIDEKYWGGRGVHVNEKGSIIKSELFADFINNYLKRY